MHASTDGSGSSEEMGEVSPASLTFPKHLTSAFSQVARAPGGYLPRILKGALSVLCVSGAQGRSGVRLRKMTHLLQGAAQNGTAILENNLVLINITLPNDPANSLLGIYLREMKTYIHTEACMQMFTAVSLFLILKN